MRVVPISKAVARYIVLAGLSYETCLVYLDDVIVFGSTFDELLHRTEVVFQRIRDAKLKLKP